MSPRPCRGGDKGGVSDIKEGDRGTWKIFVWAKTLTPPLPQGLTPNPSPKGEGNFKGAGSQ